MNTPIVVAVIIAAIASIIEIVGSYALITGMIEANPHAVLMCISGIIAMWVAILIALTKSK